MSRSDQPNLAQVVRSVIMAARRGRGVSISRSAWSALQLVLLNRGVVHASDRQERRAADSVLYGLNGRVVQVALPKLMPQKTQVAQSQ